MKNSLSSEVDILLLKEAANRYFLNLLQKNMQKNGINSENSFLLRVSLNHLIELNINAFPCSFMLLTCDFLAISYNKVYHSNGPLKCKLS